METVKFKGKEHRVFSMQAFSEEHEVFCVEGKYETTGMLAVSVRPAEEPESEYFGNLTVSLPGCYDLPDGCQFVDASQPWDTEGFVKANGLGEPTWVRLEYENCIYTLFRFHPEKFTV